ncbi:MAG TPA: hypothetical protein VJQ54_08765 [Candidatus Sulfotelmatobacter sp.]|nr:hypothetical protein [Candidatus Sulfotelmatobacter sp.]
MPKRGKVLRDPHIGPGLLMVEGKQYPFLMEGLWRSDVPAKPGLVVAVDFDPHGNLHSITAVGEDALFLQSSSRPRDFGSALSQGWTLLRGTPAQLAAAALLMLSWCFLSAVSIHLPSFGRADLTFWQLLGYLNAGNLSTQISDVVANPDPGVLGFTALLVLAGAFLPFFWSRRGASLGGFLPLVFMIVAGYLIATQLHSSLTDQFVGGYAAGQAQHVIRNGISLGLGTYVSISLGTYFSVMSVMRLAGADYGCKGEWGKSQEFAA